MESMLVSDPLSSSACSSLGVARRLQTDPSGSYPELIAELIEPDRGWRSGWLTAGLSGQP